MAGPSRHVVEVTDPLPAAKSVALRIKIIMKPLRSVPPTEESLAAELLAQMKLIVTLAVVMSDGLV